MRKHIGSAWLGDNYYDYHLKFFKDWSKEYLSLVFTKKAAEI